VFASVKSASKDVLQTVHDQNDSVRVSSNWFDTDTKSWHDIRKKDKENSEAMPLPQKIAVLAFNIRKEKDNLAVRMQALLDLIEDTSPDIIMLQENTKAHHEYFLNSPFIQNSYYVSGFEGQSGPGFKVSIICRFPLQFCLVHAFRRPCLLGRVLSENGEIGFASVHLTSGNNAGIRSRQIERIQNELSTCTEAIIAGDTNMSESMEDAKASRSNGYKDVWFTQIQTSDKSKSKSLQNGVTRPMHSTEYSRLDRIFHRGTNYSCNGVLVVGNDLIPGYEDIYLTISDHYGIFTTFSL